MPPALRAFNRPQPRAPSLADSAGATSPAAFQACAPSAAAPAAKRYPGASVKEKPVPPALLLCQRPAVPDADFADALAEREQAGAGHHRGGEAGAVLAEGD